MEKYIIYLRFSAGENMVNLIDDYPKNDRPGMV